jgi:hypothetical protein
MNPGPCCKLIPMTLLYVRRTNCLGHLQMAHCKSSPLNGSLAPTAFAKVAAKSQD